MKEEYNLDFIRPLASEFSDAYGEFAFQYSKAIGNPIDEIILGSLKMYAIELSTEVDDFTEIFNKIESAFPVFKKICEKPKSHLKAINEVRPIDTVKRVGYESIPYLASHSMDWLARTASGLKPARLFSRVEDDEYQIYENRVVKTAIDAIYLFLKRCRADLNYKAKQLEGIISSRVQTNSFGFDVGFQRAVCELIPSDNSGDEHHTKQFELAERLLAQAINLLKKYRVLYHSRLYRYLRRAKQVSNPLNETNILLMDKNYNVIFKLWKDIQKIIAPKENGQATPDDVVEQHNSYKLFCRILCEYTAHTMKFEQTGIGVFQRESDNVRITVKEELGNIVVKIMDATKRELQIEKGLVCPIANGENHGSFELKNQILYWSNDVTVGDIDDFCALLKTRDSRGKEQAVEKTRYAALKGAIDQAQRNYGRPKSHKIVILTSFYDIEDELRNKFSDFMKNVANETAKKIPDADFIVIALPKCQNNEQELTTYAKQQGEKVAFLPLTMFDINSYRRIQQLFLRLIMKIGTGKCPYCGSNTRKTERGRLQCMNCNLIITETMCDEPSCKHKYTYLSYNAKQEILDRMKLIGADDFYVRDSMFQYKDIVGLSVDERIVPVCPKCGHK